MSAGADSTYGSRVLHFIRLTNPKHALHSNDKILKSQKIVDAIEIDDWVKAREIAGGSINDKIVAQHKEVVEACIHPVTKDIIPVYGRMGAFIPLNVPLCTGLALSRTVTGAAFWQWLNQSYNAIFNYSQAAKGLTTGKHKVTTTNQDIATGYGAAVVVSVGLAVGLSQMLTRSRMSAGLKNALGLVVPYTAAASAGGANVFFMRRKELEKGIPVFNEDGACLGNSREAAAIAIKQAVLSRFVLSMPTIGLPPLLIALAKNISPLVRTNLRRRMLEISTVTMGVGIGLPCAAALFPKRVEVDSNNFKKEKFSVNGTVPRRIFFDRGI